MEIAQPDAPADTAFPVDGLAIKDRLPGQKQNDYSIYITAAYGFNRSPAEDRRGQTGTS
jgi:hypothetical protein